MADFIAMFVAMGWTNPGATSLVNDEGLDTFAEIAKLDKEWTSRICTVFRRGMGGNAGIAVTGKAEHNLWVTTLLARQAVRTSRTLDTTDIDPDDAYQFEGAIAQFEIESEWDNAPGIASFEPIKEVTLRKGWPYVRNLLMERARAVRGKTTKVLLPYLFREDLFPKDEDDDPEEGYADFDSQLIARFPIIKEQYDSEDEDELELDGPSKKPPQVNADNAVLCELIVKSLDQTSWRTHYIDAVKDRDGRLMIRMLGDSLTTSVTLDNEYHKNRATIEGLRYNGETKEDGIVKYINRHKHCHTIQARLHDDHQYPNFLDRDIVRWLTNGIMTNEYDSVILTINGDPLVREDFKAAADRILEWKAITDERKKRKISAVDRHSGGRGGGGRGSGGRGQGRGGRGGRDGGGRGGRGSSSRATVPYRLRHVTTKGGSRCNAAKNEDGSWAHQRIRDGGHDDLARLQTHITRASYPDKDWKAFEPLERRKVYINKFEAAAASSGGGGTAHKVPRAVSVVSTDDTVSTLASTVTAMQKNMATLTQMAKATERAIADMRSQMMGGDGSESDSTSDFMDSDTHDENGHRKIAKRKGNSANVALMRQSGKLRTKKSRHT